MTATDGCISLLPSTVFAIDFDGGPATPFGGCDEPSDHTAIAIQERTRLGDQRIILMT